MSPDPDERDAATRLSHFADRLQLSLGSTAKVERRELSSADRHFGTQVILTPVRADAVSVGWIEIGNEVIVETMGGPGGRWELSTSEHDVSLVEDLVLAIIEGRATETFALGRSKVTVTLSDGRALSERGAVAPAGCIPMPRWTRWGRTVSYAAYGN